jgi:hypothetical protein
MIAADKAYASGCERGRRVAAGKRNAIVVIGPPFSVVELCPTSPTTI